MRPLQYFQLTETSGIAVILKSGSSAIAKAVIDAKHPDVASTPVSFPDDGRDANRPGWQGVCPKIENPETAYAVIREPVERFRSGFAQTRQTDVDSVLTRLESGDWFNLHFYPQARLRSGTKLYRFPEHLDDLSEAAGLGEIPTINEDSTNTNPPKPELTSAQELRVQAIYADDTTLYDSITEAGQVFTVPPTAEELGAATIQAAWDVAAAAFESLPLGKQALWEPVRVKVADYIQQGDFASAVETLQTVPSLYEGMDDERNAFLQLFL